MSWRGTAWFGVAATLLTGALFLVSIDMGPIGPLALIAPSPLLIYALSAPRAWKVGLAAAGARTISMTGIVYVYRDGLPISAIFAMMTIAAAIFAIVALLTRWIARVAPPAFAVFSYPVLLVTSELLIGLVSPHGSFGAMGYALVDILPLLQVASLGGLAALTFSVALAPMAVSVAIVRPVAARTALIAGGVPLLLAVGFGVARLSQGYQSHVRVALVGLDAFEAHAFAGEKEDLETAVAFAAAVRALATDHPDYIVLPEKQLGGARIASVSIHEIALAAAAAAPATVIAGFDELLPEGRRVNSAQVLEPGKPLRRYLKRRFIPGAELGYTPGTESFVDGTLGVAICKDMDFPDMIRDYGRRGVELMLVPAWDFVCDGRMHSRMALVRGVENGFALARAAASGRLTASDRCGRVIAEAVTSHQRRVFLVTDLGLRGGGTVYARIGDVFAWTCAGLAVLFLAWRVSRSLSARVGHVP
jgi:apolipoprotein N-acyltransferase